jgi:putative ATP-binding cassette transporter
MGKAGSGAAGLALSVFCWLLGVGFAGPVSSRQTVDIAQLVGELTRRWDVRQVPTGAMALVVGDTVRTRRLGDAQPGAFELASCSKAFTGLLIAILEQEGVLSRQDPITRWIPELGERARMGYSAVRIENLLNHTSGISSDTLDLLEPDSSADALSRLPLLLKDVPLAYAVGTREEYATLNYSLLGVAAERATGKSFATLLREKIFGPLGMRHTWVEGGAPLARGDGASASVPGYKISFTTARRYDAPRYHQNTPAGYVLSTPEDMAIWLQFFLQRSSANNADPELRTLYAAREQVKRRPEGARSTWYAYGWDVDSGTTTGWSHPGQNPNATAYVAFDPEKHVGIALLGNSNSPQVIQIGEALFAYLRGTAADSLPRTFAPDTGDRVSTVAALAFWLGLAALVPVVLHRRRTPVASSEVEDNEQMAVVRESLVQSSESTGWPLFVGRLIAQNTVLVSVLVVAPHLLVGLGWNSLLVWGPASAPAAAIGLLLLVNVADLSYFIVARHGDWYPSTRFARLVVAKVVGLTVISGLLSSALVLCILYVIDSTPGNGLYSAVLLFACIYFYIASRRAAEQQIMQFGHIFVQGLRMQIIRKLLDCEYQDIERLPPGKIQAVVGEDSQDLARSVAAFVPFFANLLTIVFLFAYLLLWRSTLATLVLLGCALPMIALYYTASERADRMMSQALAARGEFMGTVEDLQKGYKGLGRQGTKRNFYEGARRVSDRFKALRITYDRGFLNAFFVGESLLTGLLVAVALVFPLIIPRFGGGELKDYLIILLYLIGPLNVVMVSIPELVRLKSLLRNMMDFSASLRTVSLSENVTRIPEVKTLELHAVQFQYPSTEREGDSFAVGPVSFKAEGGKSYFLTGGNGSGKSTLAMILAGLYAPAAGAIRVNGACVSRSQLLELTQAIFSDNWLLRRVYIPELLQSPATVNDNIALLGLGDKATLRCDGTFDTIQLSTGQRKRLSLALLLADPSPLVILDEWGAEQDPIAKARFYKEWLPLLKAQKRIVFVVTHDDEYFSQADVLITMKNGQFVAASG